MDTSNHDQPTVDNVRIKRAFDILNRIDCHHEKTTNNCSPKKPICNKLSSPTRIISTPALEALRSRTTRRTRSVSSSSNTNKNKRSRTNSITSKPTSAIDSEKLEVNPSSESDFLDRLGTFKLSSYPAGKPPGLSPPSMAAHGWTNVQKNRLKCICCAATWVLSAPSRGDWNSASGTQLAALGARMRTEQHRNSCPWRNRCSPPTIYRIPRWKNSIETFDDLIKSANQISDALFCNARPMFDVQHTLPDQAVTTLSIALQSQNPSASSTTLPSRSSPTTDALILALFGWSIKLVTRGRRDSSQSSVSAIPCVQEPGSTSLRDADDTITSLHCKLCHRQALPSSSLTSIKAFNPTHEHREYCPFIDPHAGFEAPHESVAVLQKPGWQVRLEAVQNVLDRQNLSISINNKNLSPLNDQTPSSCITLENIASHFNSSSRPDIHNHTINRHPYNQSEPYNSSSPQINLLNFVKAVLVGPPASSSSL
ncbi:hypothetical protein PSTT_16900 [Puccinia striiformis]|uniref:C3HC-type domain-containing protein n=1 Tax=Puccinia striiformis TaxID=27350 RepID=A0A2S4UAP3_9BASI|nr:hypothetical protein PSTT_16900 [Puccinia striiformis]